MMRVMLTQVLEFGFEEQIFGATHQIAGKGQSD
jgi:hypothetical protein